MHHKHPVPGPGAPFADIVGEDALGGVRLVFVKAHGQESRRFADDEDVPVLMEDFKASGPVSV